MTINVFIVDDSATARTALRLILETSEDINVLGVASNPLIALKRMVKTWPDVIISDIEMPEMDGIEFLHYIQKNKPTPFIVFSNHTGSSAVTSVEALARGALDIIPKPNFGNSQSLEEASIEILNAVRAAAKLEKNKNFYNVGDLPSPTAEEEKPSLLSLAKRQKPEPPVMAEVPPLAREQYSVIAIGSSTGGTTIIEKILTAMSPNCPGIVIVQHMPELFTKAFANRINQFCRIHVKEAEDGDMIKPGLALIAPGGMHMAVARRLNGYFVHVFNGEYVNRHKPSVDVLFNSVAETFIHDALGVILTGMGKDGAKGLLMMQQAGANTIAQAEEDCAVYGMPKAAKAMGAVEMELNSPQIMTALSRLTAR